jgi:MYXO-CTERM domain-containing protein
VFSAGKRVAQVDGDTLSFTTEDPAGTTLDLLAVAVAKNAPVMRAGWPTPEQQPQADVQGWTHLAVTIAEPAPDGGAGGSGGEGGSGGSGGEGGSGGGGSTKSQGGCGCRTAPAPEPQGAAVITALAALALSRRARRS